MLCAIDRGVQGSVLALALLVGCSAELPPEELLLRAESAVAAGNYSAALIDARSLLQQQPGHPDARRIVGEIELWGQNPGAAAEQFERALRTRRNSELLTFYAEALVRAGDLDSFSSLVSEDFFAGAETESQYLAVLARSLSAQGKLPEAKSIIGRALRASPKSLPVRLAAAEIMSEEGGDIAAIASAVTDIVADYPDSDRAWAYLGKLYFVMRNFDAATQALKTSISINPNRFDDHVLYASALLKGGKLDEADQAILGLEQLTPNAPSVNLLRAELQLVEDDVAEALTSINKVLSVAPRQPAVLYLAGMINSEAGNLETARRNLLDLLGMQPQQTSARLKLAAIQLAMEEPQAAEKSARLILEENPMNASATRILAAALALTGKQVESLEAFGRAMELNPASTATASLYAGALTKSGDFEASVVQLRAARDLDPASADTRAQLAAALLASGNGSEAIAESENFLETYPEDPTAHSLAGSVAVSAGDIREARRHFEGALALDASNVAANFGLASLAIEDGNVVQAEEYYQRVLQGSPDHLPTLLRMAVLSESVGDFDAMESRLESAIDRHPAEVQPRISLARYRISKSRYRDVVSLLAPVSSSSNGASLLHELLARSYLALDQDSLALTQAIMFVSSAPENVLALTLRAKAEVGVGRLTDAENTLRAAAELSDSPLINEQMLTVLLKAKKFDAARAELDRIPTHALTPARYQFARGRISESEGDVEGAELAFARSFELEPRSHSLLALTNTLWRRGDQAGAITELYAWLNENPSDTLIIGHLGNLHLLIGEEQAAFTLFEKLNTLRPGSAEILNNLAWAGRETDPSQSLIWIKQAMELAPNNPGIQDTYSMVLMSTGETKEALNVNNRLQKQSPRNPGFMLHEAEILVALDRDDEALAILTMLIDEGKVVDKALKLKSMMVP